MWSTEGSLFAFGWLPDKKPISYFTFIVLVLLAFKEKENEILEIYGKSELKLRKIKCDYEVAIHKGLDMFTLSGCYFHFSQAIWRKVMMSGLYVAYMQDKQFNRFVRMVMALAFLPINRLEPALDRLREYSFSLTSQHYEKVTQFQPIFLDYFQATWISGSFPPALWNHHNKFKDLTNNQNEGRTKCKQYL